MSRDKLFQTDHLRKDLKSKAVRGGSFTVVAQGSRLALRLLSTAVLARLLSPEDYGLIGMTLVVSGFVGIVRDGGLIYVTVQKEEITHEEVSLLFWVNVAIGVLIAIALVSLSPLVALLFGEPRLQALLCVLAIPFLFGGCAVQHKALLQRHMRFGAIAVIEIGSMVCAIAAAIVLAWWGFGYWALAGLEIVLAAAAMALAWILLPWRPSRPRRMSGMISTWKFGSNIVLFNVVNYITRNADNALIGWYWGAASLGLYSRAYSLLMMPIQNINAPFSAVAVPVLSRASSDPSLLRRYFSEAVSMVAAVVIPIVVCATAFAEDLVRIWLGEQWMATAVIFQLLAVPAFLFGASQPITWIYIVMDRTDLLRNVGFAMAPVNVAAFCIGLPWGPEGVALGYTISSSLLFLPVVRYALKGTGIRMLDMFKTWTQPVLGAATGAAAGLAAKAFLLADQPPLVTAFGSIAVFGLAYGATMVLVFGWHRRAATWYARKAKGGGMQASSSESAG